MKEAFVEIKIGIQHSAREVSLESTESSETIETAVKTALDKGGVLELVDEKGRKILVPADKVAYVEIGEPASRRVGFGAI
jgi:flagellar biosynthesis/type III secretory pathway M-ring protein FliF/YscJ